MVAPCAGLGLGVCFGEREFAYFFLSLGVGENVIQAKHMKGGRLLMDGITAVRRIV